MRKRVRNGHDIAPKSQENKKAFFFCSNFLLSEDRFVKMCNGPEILSRRNERKMMMMLFSPICARQRENLQDLFVWTALAG